ncbi:DUF3887 domain-containing protein [Luteimonas sp. MHLX1A]|uniref:DUF3887 domain-containing protein n=1 Tax=Alterluteimonas muca TaxID=2878684 RepID=UPI001E3C673E|nr:DUF3887 domain-containing protein [Luteimonas sp. MHLX1A]MCD9046104.1 DUF3887 domain-containing protein [Luteimonas sp. MHLX1A]
MRNRLACWMTALLLAFATCVATARDTPQAGAAAAIDQLEAGEFETLHARFNTTMAAQIDAGQLRQVWDGLVAQAGALQSRGEPVQQQHDGYEVVVTPLQFERASLNAIVSFDADGRIAGLLLQPAGQP